ncbi:type II toxin-antitoxin system HicB family antitoxin [Pasteurella multocida]|nr:type II toxin-antitoxin system HicB family antitoxin [Pasteurella multocida]
MKNVLEYKEFIGSVDFSLEDNILFGTILYINGLITYEANTLEELKIEFEAAVDDYIEFCQKQGLDAYKSFNGKFSVRVSPDLHKKASLLATKRGLTLNSFVCQAIENEVLSSERETSTVYRYMQNTISATMAIIESNDPISIDTKIFKEDVQYKASRVTIS